jgi:predicted regulator of Ras-like GTPase activity (Roadblock/LC7/MglB family)
MVDPINDLLAKVRADNDLDLAAVSTDGLLVGVDAAEDLDVEGVCLTAGDIYLMKSALGAELGRGTPTLLTVEYESGMLVVGSLAQGAELILLTRNGANLGRLRLAARRFQEQYAEVQSPATVTAN